MPKAKTIDRLEYTRSRSVHLQKADLPSEPEMIQEAACPMCGAEIIHESGCVRCVCGWSRC